MPRLRFLALLAICSAVLAVVGHTSGYSHANVSVALQAVVGGLTDPLYVTSAHDGTSRLFIVEQGGRIKVLQPGATTPTTFLDITAKVLAGGERGLLGLAFHPDFTENRRFFVNYTRQPDGATVIAEYRASILDPNVASPSETVLLTIPQPFANHNGGMIEFGPDGYLYIGVGDGGSANDPGNRAQNIEELLGKVLRIDVDSPGDTTPYSSPPDNPFFGAQPGRDEIYALGFRNPWRFSFDRATDDLILGDVGQGAREEVDVVTGGGNYGWRVFEGTRCTNLDPDLCGGSGFIFPIAEYDHTGGRCSITGGYVYRGSDGSLPAGAYVYADFCTGEIFLLNDGVTSLVLDTDLNISSFGEDEAGEIYVVDLNGTVYRLVNPDAPPPATLTAALSARPSSVRSGGLIILRLDVTNNGPAATNVTPSALTVEGDGAADRLLGPFPRSAAIAPGASETFRWLYRATSAGIVRFTGFATSPQGESPVTTSNDVTIIGR